MKLFKTIPYVDKKSYHEWARKNYVAGENIPGIWHPIVQLECVRMNVEKFKYEDFRNDVRDLYMKVD